MSSIVYLDVCCLKWPKSDQRATRVQLETAAVAALIERAERGEIRLLALGQRHREQLKVSITNPTHLLQKLAGGAP